jgi:hypothetical protein
VLGTNVRLAGTTAEIIFDESVRAIVRQQGVVEGIRSRAGTIFAAASLVTAFLGGQALSRDPDFNAITWVAIAAFVALFVCTLSILWPWPFRFVLSADILIEDHLEKEPDELHLYLAKIWRKNYVLNQAKIRQLHTVFRAACLVLMVEVVAWLISIGRG